MYKNDMYKKCKNDIYIWGKKGETCPEGGATMPTSPPFMSQSENTIKKRLTIKKKDVNLKTDQKKNVRYKNSTMEQGRKNRGRK